MMQVLNEHDVRAEIAQCRSVMAAQQVQRDRLGTQQQQEQEQARAGLDDLYRRAVEAMQAHQADVSTGREATEQAMRTWAQADEAVTERVTYWQRRGRGVDESMTVTRRELDTAREQLSLVLAGGRPRAITEHHDLLIDTLGGTEQVRVELDAGIIDMPAAEAWQVLEELAPGEGFEVLAILPLPPLD